MYPISGVGYETWMELLRWHGRRYSFELRMMWCDLYNALLDLHNLAPLEGAEPIVSGSPVGLSFSPGRDTLSVTIADAASDRGRMVFVVNRDWPYRGLYALLEYADSLAMLTIGDYAASPLHINNVLSLHSYRKHFPKCLDPLRPEDLQAVARVSSA